MQAFNPFKQNGILHFHQLDQSISVLWVVGLYFSFSFKSNRTVCKQTVETLIRRHSDLGLYCLPMLLKKNDRRMG